MRIFFKKKPRSLCLKVQKKKTTVARKKEEERRGNGQETKERFYFCSRFVFFSPNLPLSFFFGVFAVWVYFFFFFFKKNNQKKKTKKGNIDDNEDDLEVIVTYDVKKKFFQFEAKAAERGRKCRSPRESRDQGWEIFIFVYFLLTPLCPFPPRKHKGKIFFNGSKKKLKKIQKKNH